MKVRLNKDRQYGWAPPLAVKYKGKTYQWKSREDLLALPDDPVLLNIIRSKRWHPGGSCCKTVRWLQEVA